MTCCQNLSSPLRIDSISKQKSLQTLRPKPRRLSMGEGVGTLDTTNDKAQLMRWREVHRATMPTISGPPHRRELAMATRATPEEADLSTSKWMNWPYGTATVYSDEDGSKAIRLWTDGSSSAQSERLLRPQASPD